MKLKIVPLMLLSFLLVSCVWTPVDDAYKVKEKKSYKTFESLRDPVVIPMLLAQQFSQNNSVDCTEHFGSALIVYDWENNSVYDYIFTPVRFYCQVFTSVRNSSGVVNHYYFDNELNIMSPSETKLQKEKISTQNLYLQTVDRGYVSERDLVLPYRKSNDDNNNSEGLNYGFKILDKETGKFSDGQDFSTESEIFFITDADGVVWIAGYNEDEEKKVRSFYIKKWDDESKTFGVEEPLCERNYEYEFSELSDDEIDFSNYTTYKMEYLDEDYAIISQRVEWIFSSNGKEDKTCLVIINRKDKSITEVPYKIVDANMKIYKLNNQLYVFYEGSDDLQETKLMADKLDIGNRTLISCHSFENYSYKNYVFVRNENLYFYSMDDNKVSIWKFNSAEEQFQNGIDIGIDDLLALLLN